MASVMKRDTDTAQTDDEADEDSGLLNELEVDVESKRNGSHFGSKVGPYVFDSALGPESEMAESGEEGTAVTPAQPMDGATSSQAAAEPVPSDQPSAFRSLVRSLTPKKRPKPILVKAGFQQKGNAEDDRDLRVTFNISNGGRSISTSQLPGTTPSCFQDCCNHPILPVAGTLSLIGGISFGYDIGIISGVLQPLREQFNLTCLQEQVMVGCLIGGALLVSLCGGPWIDKCGRRRGILISSIFFIFGTLLSSVAPNLDVLAGGRLLQGFGMSMAAIAECIYVSEIAPKEKRGFMVGLNEMGITVGFVLAFFVGFLLHGVKNSWRIMMGIGAIPAVIQLVGTFFFLPPSPREKMMNKCDREAILILEHLRGNRNDAMNEFAAIRHSLVIEESYGSLALFRSADNMLFRMLVGFSLVFLQQVSGQPNVLYYASVVFEQVGFSTRMASLATLGLGIIKVIATAVALSVTDTKGRRFFLVAGCLLMAASIALLGLSTVIKQPTIVKPCERYINLTFPSANTEKSVTFSKVTPTVPISIIDANISAVLASKSMAPAHTIHVAQLVFNFFVLMVYVVGYSIGFGPMVWLVLSELYPAGVKGRAMSYANIINWATSLVVSLTFLRTMTVVTPGGTFIGFCIINLFAALYIYLVLPETKGKSLERISYELRTTRPKQRFDENLKLLCPWWKGGYARPSANYDYTPVDRNAVI